MEKYYDVIASLLICLIIISSSLFGRKAYGEIEDENEQKGYFELRVKDDFISLNANDASLKKILEELGRRMNIEVAANIPEEERINIKFHSLSLSDALEKLSLNYGYIMNTADGKKKIARIFVLAKGNETDKGKLIKLEVKETIKENKLQPEPFKFEFDPLEFVKE